MLSCKNQQRLALREHHTSSRITYELWNVNSIRWWWWNIITDEGEVNYWKSEINYIMFIHFCPLNIINDLLIIHISNNNGSFTFYVDVSLLYHCQHLYRTWLYMWVTQMLSYVWVVKCKLHTLVMVEYYYWWRGS
jgi:hypothetical protein